MICKSKWISKIPALAVCGLGFESVSSQCLKRQLSFPCNTWATWVLGQEDYGCSWLEQEREINTISQTNGTLQLSLPSWVHKHQLENVNLTLNRNPLTKHKFKCPNTGCCQSHDKLLFPYKRRKGISKLQAIGVTLLRYQVISSQTEHSRRYRDE